MKCYLITNPAKVYVERIKAFIERPRRGRGQRQDANGNVIVHELEEDCIVSSREAFEAQTFKKAFYNAGAHKVLIVPELFWDHHDGIDAGYRVARALLEGRLKDKFFHLVFISIYKRDQLRKLVGPEFSEMVNAFPHLTLGSLLDQKTEVPATYSDIQFELIKRTVVSRSGRVDYLLHTLSDLDKVGLDSAQARIGPILDVLSLPAFGGEDAGKTEELAALKKRFPQLFTPEEVRQFSEQLRLYLNRLKSEFATRSGCPEKKFEYSVLIIEDDRASRQNLLNFFKERFSKVEAWDLATIRMAKEKIAESVRTGDRVEEGKYDLILIDLLFTESGKAGDYLLPFNGLDLLEELRRAESCVVSERGTVRHAAVRIVSALPRDVISRLVEMHKGMESPAVFTKGGGWEQLQGCLIDRMDDMVKECEYYRKQRDFLESFPRPRQGIFKVPGVLEALLANQSWLDEIVQKVRNLVEKNQMPTNKTSLLSPGKLTADALMDKSKGKLESVLFHRQLVINYLRHQGSLKESDLAFREVRYVFVEKDYREYAKRFGIKLQHYDTSYLTTKLGFELSDAPRAQAGAFTCCINLSDRTQFFANELVFEQDSFVPNTETQELVNQATEYLKNKAEEDATSFEAAGITRHLVVGPSAESFLQMLRDVIQYLKSADVDEDVRFDLWSIFDDFFSDEINLDNTPDLRTRINNCCPEMGDLIAEICVLFRG